MRILSETDHRTFDQARALMAQNSCVQAVDLLRSLKLRTDDNNELGDICFSLASCARSMGLLLEARQSAQEALCHLKELLFERTQVRLFIASLLFTKGKLQEAIEEIDDILNKEPRSKEYAAALRGQILMELGKVAEAIGQFEIALHEPALEVEYRADLCQFEAECHYRLHDFASALSYVQQARKLGCDKACLTRSEYLLAKLLLETGQRSQAKTAGLRALEFKAGEDALGNSKVEFSSLYSLLYEICKALHEFKEAEHYVYLATNTHRRSLQ